MRLLALAGVVIAVAAPGVTPRTVAIGTTGEGGSFLRGAAAYVRLANARGGVHGRTIALAATGAVLGQLADVAPALPPYDQGRLYARRLVATDRRATVAVLFSDDAYGRALLQGFRSRAASLVVATAAAADVSTQVGQLQASGATTLCVFTPADVASRAFAAARSLGWRPQVYVSDAEPAPEGAVSALWAKDPHSPAYARDPVLARVPRDPVYVQGLAAGYTLVDVLEHAGAYPTRATFRAALAHLHEVSNPYLVPGVEAPVTTAQLVRRHNGTWLPFGGVM